MAMAVAALRGRKDLVGQMGKQGHKIRFGGKGLVGHKRELISTSECCGKPLNRFQHGLTCSGFHVRTSVAGMQRRSGRQLSESRNNRQQEAAVTQGEPTVA